MGSCLSLDAFFACQNVVQELFTAIFSYNFYNFLKTQQLAWTPLTLHQHELP
jgi:hypothetical protein